MKSTLFLNGILLLCLTLSKTNSQVEEIAVSNDYSHGEGEKLADERDSSYVDDVDFILDVESPSDENQNYLTR